MQTADIGAGGAIVWSLALLAAAIAAAILLYGTPTNPTHVGLVIGHVLGGVLVALLIGGLFCWLAKTRFRRTLLVTWTIVLPVAYGSVLLDNQQQQRAQGVHQALVSLTKAMDSKNPASSTSVPSTTNGTASINSASASSLQIAIEHITQDSIVFKQKEAIRLQAQRDLHLEMALTPQRLVSAQGIAASRQSLERYRSMLAEHQIELKAFEDRNQSYLAEIRQPLRTTVLTGFLQSRAQGDEAFARFFAVENRYIGTAEQVLNVAQQALGRSHLDFTGKLMLPEPMHTQIQGLAQTLNEEVFEERAAKQELQSLKAEHEQAMDRLLQQGTPSSL
ncbi:hypothetical protein DWU98_06855 [Dyella monticola]|uniref:Uncharacterized protein n=1 Tax=Dyella monticola TaxID=1927958 RepID=A0A370X3Q2_9GAMM|nr:hypothetical protein [Dyella monticola]RDS82855.1 hypothetical protein DWU98_06855 [Dyella monticola]